jgi:hypothetical protein
MAGVSEGPCVIDVYITHYVTAKTPGANAVLADQIHGMRRTTPIGNGRDEARLCVVYWTDDDACADDLHARMPIEVDLTYNDRIPDSLPSVRNKVLELARKSGCEAFILLHNDVRPAHGWFQHLVADWRAAEAKYGASSSVVSPRYIPYHLPDSSADIAGVFGETPRALGRVLTSSQMVAWISQWHNDGFGFLIDQVTCPPTSRSTEDGHQLMMFIAGPRFFDDVGECDEAMSGAGWDDIDWGMRALIAGKRSLQSTGALIGHIAELVHQWGPRAGERADNTAAFIAKWGQETFDEVVSGKIWPRLRNAQVRS